MPLSGWPRGILCQRRMRLSTDAGMIDSFDVWAAPYYNCVVMTRMLKLPFCPLMVIQAPDVVTWDWFMEQVCSRLRDGVSVCLVSQIGHDLRGGYFFHIRQFADRFEFFDFDANSFVSFPDGLECATFINHVTGRVYDDEMWDRCRLWNLRVDVDVMEE